MARSPYIVANLLGAARSWRSNYSVVGSLSWYSASGDFAGRAGRVLVYDISLFVFAGADCRLPCGGLWLGAAAIV